jgi:polyphosphate kinase
MEKTETKIYINREISWLKFNERVLEEAENDDHPLLERLKFLSIFVSNLDEFFMIRVSGVKEQIDSHIFERSPDGMTPAEQLNLIYKTLNPLLERHAKTLQKDILPKLRKAKIYFRSLKQLNPKQKEYIESYFRDQIFPVLTPIAIDSAHPIPLLRGLNINFLVELKVPYSKNEPKLAFVPIPNSISRFIIFENNPGLDIVLLEEVIEEYIETLFPNMKIVSISQFRITRNADLDIAEEEADDLLKLIEKELRKRRLGSIIRLEVSNKMEEEQVQFLREAFDLGKEDVYSIDGPLAINNFMQLLDQIDDPDLKDEPFTPVVHPAFLKSENIFSAIKSKDIVLFHPYDSFNPVVEFIKSAASDPAVVAIKMTLYRTSNRSPIIQSLIEAAENGKQVTALIELKARFSEELNILRAKELERAGANVVYGMIGLKTHGKMTLILRNEGGVICPYVHLGTGNYNEKTAFLYTDLSYLTADREIGADIAELFNVLTGFSGQKQWRSIYVAPLNMRDHFKKLISETINHHTTDNPSRIRLMMNSLVDPEMIKALYHASKHGVKIDCLVRGICCLMPGIEGMSENITVRSIVGRFLEHCRLYSFEFNGETHIYAGSADWMQRNLNRRIEVIFPIKDTDLKQYVLHILDAYFRDNQKARFLQPDQRYILKPLSNGEVAFSAQDYFLKTARSKYKYLENILNQPLN